MQVRHELGCADRHNDVREVEVPPHLFVKRGTLPRVGESQDGNVAILADKLFRMFYLGSSMRPGRWWYYIDKDNAKMAWSGVHALYMLHFSLTLPLGSNYSLTRFDWTFRLSSDCAYSCCKRQVLPLQA